MPGFTTNRLASLFAATLFFLSSAPAWTWAAEAFHPKGYDARRAESDEAKAREGREEKSITRSGEAWRGKDLTNQPRQEFNDLAKLEAKIDNVQKDKRDVIIDSKIQRQMEERNWTENQIKDLAKTDAAGASKDNTEGKNTSATVYGTRNRHIVVNDISRKVIQLSGGEGWQPDSRIEWKDKR